ncbi:hypothetical protein AUK40_05510 [Candidatus Wirthbacteria bacterium CG2_30_54_11]|uniref:DUF3324 domain-containing protein n=1 Tax=Candidatus Wirthbacteria bacterium CG2_30_54_11 TaxID=1817892 RepID=A0A1J5IUL3_9BACT|nr:MAG: hypothetical protein AUK40_05510 [Candidatus Wirthbacteria bacterium CG2_30_54_11]
MSSRNNRFRLIRWAVVSITLCSLTLTPIAPALGAASPINVLLIPNKKEYYANPGDQIRGILKVRNDSETDLTHIRAFAKDFTANDQETGDPKILDSSVGYAYLLAPWLEFSRDPVTVPAENSVDIEYVIHVPSDATPGGHYAILYISQDSPGEGQSAVGFLSQVGSLILVTVSGDVQVQGQIVEFFTGKKLYEYLPVDFYVRMQNTGNVHYRPSGTIFITDWLDRQVGTVEANESAGVVMPGSIRKYQSFWSEAFMVNEYRLDQDGNYVRDDKGNKITDLKVNWKQINLFRFGLHHAKVILAFDTPEGEKVVEAVTTFWVIPWRLILLIIAIIFIIGYGIRRWNKWYSRRLIKRYEKMKKIEQVQKKEEHKQWEKRKTKRKAKKSRIRERVQSWLKKVRGGDKKDKDLRWEE